MTCLKRGRPSYLLKLQSLETNREGVVGGKGGSRALDRLPWGLCSFIALGQPTG